MENKKLKLHLGAGTIHLGGYINIDLREVKGITDLVADCGNLPYENGTVDEIISFHLIEHFEEIEVKKLLKYWYDLLKPEGKLILETPDLYGCVKRFIECYEKDKQTRPGYMFGCHDKTGRESIPNDTHKWGFTKESIKSYLEEVGFKDIVITGGTDYHSEQSGKRMTIRAEGIK